MSLQGLTGLTRAYRAYRAYKGLQAYRAYGIERLQTKLSLEGCRTTGSRKRPTRFETKLSATTFNPSVMP